MTFKPRERNPLRRACLGFGRILTAFGRRKTLEDLTVEQIRLTELIGCEPPGAPIWKFLDAILISAHKDSIRFLAGAWDGRCWWIWGFANDPRTPLGTMPRRQIALPRNLVSPFARLALWRAAQSESDQREVHGALEHLFEWTSSPPSPRFRALLLDPPHLDSLLIEFIDEHTPTIDWDAIREATPPLNDEELERFGVFESLQDRRSSD